MASTHAPILNDGLRNDGLDAQAPSSVTERRSGGATPWLWIALIVAMFAGALVWLQQQRMAVPSPAPISSERALPPVQDATRTPPPARATASERAQRAAPALRNREPQPLASNVQPTYPRDALRAGVEGSALARIHVTPDGSVDRAELVRRSGDRSLDRAVLAAVNKWQFEPAIRNGEAVASVVQVPVDFRTDR